MKLTDKQKELLIMQLAAFDRPSKIAKEFREQFGVMIDRQQVSNYDCERRGRHVNRKLRELFDPPAKSFSTMSLRSPSHSAPIACAGSSRSMTICSTRAISSLRPSCSNRPRRKPATS